MALASSSLAMASRPFLSCRQFGLESPKLFDFPPKIITL
jgi:hypothetical protein